MKKLFFFVSLALSSSLFAQAPVLTPTRLVKQSLRFSDDMNWKNMELALTRQLESFNSRSTLRNQIRFGKDMYTLQALKESAELFLLIMREHQQCLTSQTQTDCDAAFNQAINSKFNIYEPTPAQTEPGYGTSKPTLFTAYYSPDLDGSFTPDEIHKNPIYAMPTDPELKKLSREAIDFDGALMGRGLELVWVKESMYDIYLLQVQGGGRVRVQTPEGEKKMYLSYAGANGLPFKFVYHYMVAQGMLPNDRSIEAQKAYIEQNPQHARAIFSSNPSYVYFKFTDTEPLGVESIPLTEGRSIAIDTRIYKYAGAINFIQTTKPVKGPNGKPTFEPFSRFFIAQDTGGAIRGNARVDMYFGFGEEAAYVAYNTKVQGNQYFLIRK